MPITTATAHAQLERDLHPSGGLRSGNERLSNLLRNAPGFLNRESTLPCRVGDPIYLDPEMTPALRTLIDQHNRTIVTPSTVAMMKREEREALIDLSSPYECGRVLEYNDPVIIDGYPQILTVKGGGCTEFARKTGADNPWMLKIHRTFTEVQSKSLQKFPFLDHYGLMDKRDALAQIGGMQGLQALGTDCERILAVVPITELADERGRLRPIGHFKEQGIIPADAEPVLMHRALKSNFRLLDISMLEYRGFTEAIPDFADHALSEFRVLTGQPRANSTEYFSWLTQKVVSQELPLILKGFEMSSGRWQDLARNISILGQEIDLEEMKPQQDILENTVYYTDHVRRHFHNLMTSLVQFGDKLSHLGGRSIDPAPTVDIIWDAVRAAFKEDDLRATFAGFKEFGRNESFREFTRSLFISLGTPFLRYAPVLFEDSFYARHRALKSRFEQALDREISA